MWYPFYYSPQIDEKTPNWALILMVVGNIPAALATYTAIWFIPAILFGWFSWTGWLTGLGIFTLVCAVPAVIYVFYNKIKK